MADERSAAEGKERATRGGSAALLVAAGIFLSRIAGLVRERVFAHYFGTAPAAGAFRAALRIPNFLQNLFGEGVLSASFIPVYSRLLAEGKEKEAGRVAGALASLLLVFVTTVVAVCSISTPLLVDLIAPGFKGELRELTITIVRILFPGIGLLVLSAWCLGVLNSHRKFFVSYVAPVLWNAAMITTLIIFGGRFEKDRLAIALAWGTLVGCLLQFAIQIPFILRYATELRFAIDLSLAPLRQILRNTVPVIAGRGVVQVSAFVDEIIASFLGPAALASIGYASTIYMLPISLFGMSVAASELPQMSSATGTAEEVSAALRTRLEGGLRRIAFFVVPTVVAFLAIGKYLVGALYQTGEFDADDTLFVWYVLIGSTVGLLAATLGRLYSSAFYAIGDTKTPLKYAVIRVILGAGLGYLMAFPLRGWIVLALEAVGLPIPDVPGGVISLGAAGLTASSGLAAWIEFILLRTTLGRRLGRADLSLGYQARLWFAAAVAAAGALLTERFFLPISARSIGAMASHPIAAALQVAGVFGVIYLIMTLLLGAGESRAILRKLRLVR